MLDLSHTPWRLVPLKGRVCALVDAIDMPWIAEHNWNCGWGSRSPGKIYAKRNVGPARLTVYLHREIMLRIEPRASTKGYVVDHRNGQSLDCRRANLRWLTKTQNAQNRVRRSPSIDELIDELLAGETWSRAPSPCPAAPGVSLSIEATF